MTRDDHTTPRRPPARVEIWLAQRRVLRDGAVYPLRGRAKWFDLIAFLAHRRSLEGNDGYVTVDDILTLSSWQRSTKAASVGTEIWRCIRTENARPGGSLIASPQPSVGPYRLAVEADEIVFGEHDADTVAKYFGALVPVEWARATAERLRTFATHMARGDVDFRRGDLERALVSYGHAARASGDADVDRRAAALAKVTRTQQHLGEEDAASETVAAMRELLGGAGGPRHDDVLSTLTLLKHEAWVHVRHGRLGTAERTAQKGLHQVVLAGHPHTVLAGDFHNVLGQVARRRGRWADARSRYVEALRLWTLADYHYGVQAAFFNLGQLERLEGDAVAVARKRGAEVPTRAAREAYQRAERWLLDEIAYCEMADVGGNEAADLIELAQVRLRLGDVDGAVARLREAARRSVRTKNPRDIGGIRIVRGVIERYRLSGGDFRELLRA